MLNFERFHPTVLVHCDLRDAGSVANQANFQEQVVRHRAGCRRHYFILDALGLTRHRKLLRHPRIRAEFFWNVSDAIEAADADDRRREILQ